MQNLNNLKVDYIIWLYMTVYHRFIQAKIMNKLLEQLLWYGIALGMTHSLTLYVHRCTVFLEQAFSMKTVKLEVIQPSSGTVCPGQEVTLTCTVARASVGPLINLIWRQDEALSPVRYDSISPPSEPQRLGDFNTTAVFINNSVIISNATLESTALSNSNNTISCESPPQDNVQTAIIIVAGIYSLHILNNHCWVTGADSKPFGLQITASASLTWLPPPNTNCTFKYTVNITNSSCSMTVYSSSTSLILTDLLTHGQNYSFAVAVTDSTGQHGPWSDQLMVTWDGKIIYAKLITVTPSLYI